VRRLKLAEHCIRHPEEEASKLVLWTQGQPNREGRHQTSVFVNALILAILFWQVRRLELSQGRIIV